MDKLFLTAREWEAERLRILSRALPMNKMVDHARFYLEPRVLKMKYDLAMIAIEDKSPRIYKALIAVGLPSHGLEKVCY